MPLVWFFHLLLWSLIMELQSATSSLPGPLSPSPLSPTSDYAGPLSPSSGGPGPSHATSPGLGPSPSLSPIRGPSPGPGFSGQSAFNYNQLEGRFKQLQGKTGGRGEQASKISESHLKARTKDVWVLRSCNISCGCFTFSLLEAFSCNQTRWLQGSETVERAEIPRNNFRGPRVKERLRQVSKRGLYFTNMKFRSLDLKVVLN